MTEWVLTSRKVNSKIEYNSCWRNWVYCDDDAQQDLSQWNAQMVISKDDPSEIISEIHFASQEDMVMFLLRWL